ncbi:CobW family GTP-binding protein [Paenibacillus planticolens]|uniref:GTP-binding protein n=1 Tax=Paenibacillus planticolens TaxID=2654976 RepID=A0ABX1ZPT7_9BACL|nr:GTP-binding protein [Paenibacillus planticolens]NOV00615.1 GTP-binding protein [Paenibacillus planticolens]
MLQSVPIHLFSGFLGSGKTTLLKKTLDYYTESGKKPVVIMNEIGEINLDGMIIGEEVPMTEMLSGCICCTIRGDLSMAIKSLYTEHQPDAIFIESTGIANPMEIIEGVTDASLIMPVELQSIVTVVDAPHLFELSRNSRSKTLALMKEQIRCASLVILNKADKVSAEELDELDQLLREWNPFAGIEVTVYCHMDMQILASLNGMAAQETLRLGNMATCSSEHGQTCDHRQSDTGGKAHNHHTHDHVMAYTHYFNRPIDLDKFEEVIRTLPQQVYRAKGIVQTTDGESTKHHLFQYAYRELEFMNLSIKPKVAVQNVAVFIGENFSKDDVIQVLQEV